MQSYSSHMERYALEVGASLWQKLLGEKNGDEISKQHVVVGGCDGSDQSWCEEHRRETCPCRSGRGRIHANSFVDTVLVICTASRPTCHTLLYACRLSDTRILEFMRFWPCTRSARSDASSAEWLALVAFLFESPT